MTYSEINDFISPNNEPQKGESIQGPEHSIKEPLRRENDELERSVQLSLTSNDVVDENGDRSQFANQIEQANEVLGKKCKNACADSGYANTNELKKIDDKDITVIVPSQKQISDKQDKPYNKDQFEYNDKNKVMLRYLPPKLPPKLPPELSCGMVGVRACVIGDDKGNKRPISQNVRLLCPNLHAVEKMTA